MVRKTEVVWRHEYSPLEAEILQKIESVLIGEITGKDVGEWAVEKYVERAATRDGLAGSALRALMTYRLGIAPKKATLIGLKTALRGERDFVVSRTEFGREEIERW